MGGGGVFWTAGAAADGFFPEQAEPATNATEIAISVNLLIFISIYNLPPIRTADFMIVLPSVFRVNAEGTQGWLLTE